MSHNLNFSWKRSGSHWPTHRLTSDRWGPGKHEINLSQDREPRLESSASFYLSSPIVMSGQ